MNSLYTLSYKCAGRSVGRERASAQLKLVNGVMSCFGFSKQECLSLVGHSSVRDIVLLV